MDLALIDWIVLGTFLAITLFIGVYFSKRASKSLTDFFLGGRKLPWYIAGVSMVATTFAADTPLAVTEIVAQNGISGNWVWWNMLIGGMLTTFFFAKLWRRAEVLTEVEFLELRYGGKPARALRYIKSVYLGLIMNGAVIAWVNLAFVSILHGFFDIDKSEALLWVFAITLLIALYSTLSGLWGVAMNDFIQFFVAMTGSIALAIFVLGSDEVGGISGLKETLPASTFNFFPTIGEAKTATGLTVGLASFLAFIGFQWWASWYPGGEPGGGGYIAQRMMSAKTEKDSQLATLFFQFAHYCLRPWPWIIVGLAAISLYSPNHNTLDGELKTSIESAQNEEIHGHVLSLKEAEAAYPAIAEALQSSDEQADIVNYHFDTKSGYVSAMKNHLPPFWKGLMLAAFFAAFMSTISTQLNWGAGYLTNDLLKPALKLEDDKTLVRVSRITTIFLVIAGCLITTQIESIKGVWSFVIECGAGLGLVLILRWYWWRISAWSEIVATITPFVVYTFCKFYLANQVDASWGADLFTNPKTFFLTIGVTTVVWILVTVFGKPEKREVLDHFFQKVRPQGLWQYKEGVVVNNQSIVVKLILWFSAVVATYSALFFVGNLIFQFYDKLLVNGIFLAISLALFLFLFKRDDS